MTVDDMLAHIDSARIVPVFQPIVDLLSGVPHAYEVLSRGPAPHESPLVMFDRARQLGLTWELERACRSAALRKIGGLPSDLRSATRFFLNISPDVIDDPRFISGFTLAALEEYGISQSNVVIEITERATICDYAQFENAIHHYARQGFSIALDDFGSGHSGLMTLISSTPHYLKLDMDVTRHVDRDPYKQMILKSMMSLGQNIGAAVVAEGIESWSEVETLLRHGVRYAQGY